MSAFLRPPDVNPRDRIPVADDVITEAPGGGVEHVEGLNPAEGFALPKDDLVQPGYVDGSERTLVFTDDLSAGHVSPFLLSATSGPVVGSGSRRAIRRTGHIMIKKSHKVKYALWSQYILNTSANL